MGRWLIVGVLAAAALGGALMMDKGTQPSTFVSFDGTELCYYDNGGDGRPVILLHGLIVDSDMTFGLSAYASSGRRSILLDARGHGCSEKPHDPSAYADRAMARDVLALISHLGLPSTDLLGYSLGGYTALEAALVDDSRLGSIIIGGVGSDEGDEQWFRDRAPELMSDTNEGGESFYRNFADEVGADRKAIAAWFAGADLPQIRETDDLSAIEAQVFILNASQDPDPSALAARLENAEYAQFEGDHVSVLQNPDFVRRIEQILRDSSR